MMLNTRNDSCCMLLFVFMWLFQIEICKADISLVTDSAIKTLEIRIDPASASSGLEDMMFDSIRYIPLETNRQSEFSTVTQLEVSKNYYIILDGNLKTFFFFRKDGSFSHKLDRDNNKVPFKSISRFGIEKTKDILSFVDPMRSRRYSVDLHNNALVHVVWRGNDRDYISFHGYQLYYHLEEVDSNFTSLVRFEEKTGKRLGSYLPADTARKNVLLSESKLHFYHSEKGNLLFSRPYDYSVYGFDSIAVPYSRYKFIFPISNILPIDYLSNATYFNRGQEYLQSNKSIIYSIEGLYQSDNWLTFHLRTYGKGGTFLYNLSTGDLFDLRKTEDSSIGLPIVEGYNPILGSDRGALISGLTFLSLKRKYEDLSKSERENLFPARLRALMDKNSHNTILRLSYLKQNYVID